MTKRLYLAAALAVLSGPGPAIAEDAAPPLARTQLYAVTAHQCHAVDLATWKHPTKQVLIKNRVPLEGLELCNDNTYPIFHVRFSFEPNGSINDSFYLPLIADMFVANGRHAMAFVDPGWSIILTIDNNHSAAVEGLEDYAP